MKEKKREILMAIILVMMIFVIVLLIITSLSKVKLEGNCKIDKLSFNINETNEMENLSLSDGKIDCSFKIEAPLWVVLVGI